MILQSLLRSLARKAPLALARWRSDRRGNITIIFALSAIPLLVLVGLGLDYYKALSYRARYTAAADAASIAAINTAQSYINANSTSQTDPTLTNNAIAAGNAQALKVFNANAGAAESAMAVTPTIALTRTGQSFNATVTFSAPMPTNFGGLVGAPAITVPGRSTASLTMGKYLDFYLLLDVSGSMGIPTSAAAQTLLAETNPDNAMYGSTYPTGCNFACHFSGYNGFAWTRSQNIALRVDTVGTAMQTLLSTATQSETLSNQFRVGIYPFIVDAVQAAPLSSNFAAANTVAGSFANYLDQGTTNNGMGSGGTHFENLWSDMAPYLKPVGTGASATSTQPFIFLVTDGADNAQTYTPWWGWQGGSSPQLPSTAFCTSAKNAGYTVEVLYIPYVPIQNPNASFAGNEDGKVNAIIPSIPATLTACATPGFFFTASTSADITNAMQAMFTMALQAARLTQ